MRKYFSIHAALLCGMLWYGLVVLPASAQTNPPTLRIVSSNNTVNIFWTNNAHYFVLQSATDFSSPNAWSNQVSSDLPVVVNTFPATGGYATQITNLVGSNLVFSVSATDPQKFFQLIPPPPIPLCCFDIFYIGTLEFTFCPQMVRNGRVHANGPIYVGTTASLTFNDCVTTTNIISAPLLDGITTGWTPGNASTWNTSFNGNPATITNCPALVLPIGTNNPHILIEIPPAAESPVSAIGQQRFYNQAQVILIVTNDLNGSTNPTVQLTIQTSFNGMVPGNDPTKFILYSTNASSPFLSTNLSFLNLTNRFYDRRESKTNLVTQIDIERLSMWLQTNIFVQGKLPASQGLYPTILYVADRRNNSATQLPVVRLKNGAQLPANGGMGFTIATMNPLYVLGNYNVQIATSVTNASANTTNTVYTVPAALVSDTLTVLSSHWTDAASFTAYSTGATAYDATSDTINAAIVTGTMPSTGTSDTTFSGGVHNLSRFLEDWSTVTLYLNTSILRLWDSQMATNQFRNPAGFSPTPVNPYYNPPTRKFSFDPNFLNPAKMPPGIPSVAFSWPTNQ